MDSPSVDAIKPAVKYPAKQSPAPVVSVTGLSSLPAGSEPISRPNWKYRIPWAPRVQITETFLSKPGHPCRARIASFAAARISESCRAGDLVSKASNRVSNSPSLTINHDSLDQGNARISATVNMGDGLKIEVTEDEAVRCESVDESGISFCSKRWV